MAPIQPAEAEPEKPLHPSIEEPLPSERVSLAVVPREPAPDTQAPSWSLATTALVGALSGIAAILAFTWMQPRPPAETVNAVPAAARSNVVTPVETAPSPIWTGARQARWANDGSRTISFELKATSDVPVWMGRVRPQLVVRCLHRTTEVFVAIQSAASIEDQSGNHTVRLSIDDEPEMVQQWSDSESGQELFAPNPVALAKRLAHAERMRFSFTPYNANPVAAEFSVKGFEELAGLVGRTCGWRLDQTGTRAAGLGAR